MKSQRTRPYALAVVRVGSLTYKLSIIGVAPIKQVTHMRNKNSNNQGRSPNVVKVIFHTIRNCS